MNCHNKNICLVCLEDNPDTIPPCGGLTYPLFHRKCLDMANHEKSELKCPHCNQNYTPSPLDSNEQLGIKLDTTKHKLQSIMDRWLQDRGYWVKGPEYIQINNGLMNHNEANIILGSIGILVHQQLITHLAAPSPPDNVNVYIHCSNPPPPDQDAIVFRHRDSESGIETDVILRRTAILGNSPHQQGFSFQKDGFTISMSRSRYSRRFFRQASFIEWKLSPSMLMLTP